MLVACLEKGYTLDPETVYKIKLHCDLFWNPKGEMYNFDKDLYERLFKE